MFNKKLVILFLVAGISLSYAKTTNILNKRITFMNSPNINERLTKEDFLNLLMTGQYGVTIKIEDEKAKKILKEKMPYVIFRKTPIKSVLKRILGYNLFYKLDVKNKILSIKYYDTAIYNLDFINNIRSGDSSINANNSNIKEMYKFDFWGKLQKDIETLLKNVSPDDFKTPIIDPIAGIVTVTGNKKQLSIVNEYIKRLVKRLTKEVMIDVRIYSVQLDKSHQSGINWSNLSLSLGYHNNGNGTFSETPLSVPARSKYIFGSASVLSSTMFNISGFLNFLAKNGKVSSISNPKIVTLNNQKALINVGENINYSIPNNSYDENGNLTSTSYTPKTVFVGITLDITPQINDKNEIILNISPKISALIDRSQIKDESRLNKGIGPDTIEKTLNTVAKLKDGQTLILGGIITKDTTFQRNGVPILQEIPILGYAFKSKSELSTRKELVFVITPHVIDLEKTLDFSKVFYHKGQ